MSSRIPDWDGVAVPVDEVPRRRRIFDGPRQGHPYGPHRYDLDRLAALCHAHPGQIFEIPAWEHSPDYSGGKIHHQVTGSGSLVTRRLKCITRNGKVYVLAQSKEN